MDIHQELKQIRAQMASDFDFTAMTLKDMGLRFRTGMERIGSEMGRMGAEMEERFNQVEGRTHLQEHCFNRMLEVVECSQDGWKPELDEIKVRLDRLERKIA